MATLPSSLQLLIGSGLQWPFSFSEHLGGLSGLTGGEGLEKINNSIYVILATRKGSVFMNPTFGSNLPYRLFDPGDSFFASTVQGDVVDALSLWMPQIQLLDVSVQLDEIENKVAKVLGAYQVKNTPAAGSFVYPFRVGVRNLDAA